jgi:outer membrane murein-binding lipoprotein Lpp
MYKWIKSGKLFLLLCLLGVTLVAGGCEGTDTRDKVDDTVETMAGKKDVERYQQMKDDLKKAQDQEAERYRQLDQEQE